MGAATNLRTVAERIDQLVAQNPDMSRQEAAGIVISGWPIKGQEAASPAPQQHAQRPQRPERPERPERRQGRQR